MIIGISPIVVFVKDFEKSLSFYRDTLGLKTAYPPRGEWAEFKAGPTAFCIHGGGKRTNRKSSVAVHFTVKGLRALVKRLKAKGVRFLGPVKRMPWGLEVTFADPSGNVFDMLEPVA